MGRMSISLGTLAWLLGISFVLLILFLGFAGYRL